MFWPQPANPTILLTISGLLPEAGMQLPDPSGVLWGDLACHEHFFLEALPGSTEIYEAFQFFF
jgi:hypothetical protein